MANAKICLVGYTGVGKTCYIAGAYHLMKYNYKNFFIYSPNKWADRILGLQWEEMNRNFHPAPSDKTQRHQFNLAMSHSHGFPDLVFDILDYKRFYATETVLTKTELEELKQVTCVCYFLDGSILESCIKDNKIDKNDLPQQILYDIRRFLYGLSTLGSIPPISIVITKVDTINNLEDKKPIIEDFVRDMFSSLFFLTNDSIIYLSFISLGKAVGYPNPPGQLNPSNFEDHMYYAMLASLVKIQRDKKNIILERMNFSHKLPDVLDSFRGNGYLYVNGKKTSTREYFKQKLIT